MSCGEDLQRELRRRGMRVTAQRSVILETISHLGGHPTVMEVFGQARRRLPGLNAATVYRTLDVLRQAGLVDGMDDGGPARFSLRDLTHLHHHLVCSACGAVIELDPRPVRGFATQVRRRTGFQVQADHLTLTGRCRACSRKET
jgi:Fur family ferric uptake transcriptional regulator